MSNSLLTPAMVGQIAKALSEAAGHPLAACRTQRGYHLASADYVTQVQLTSDKGTHFDFAVTDAQLNATHAEFGAYLIKEYPLAFTPLIDSKKDAEKRIKEAFDKVHNANKELSDAFDAWSNLQ